MEELRRKNLYYQSNKGKSFIVGIYNAAVAYKVEKEEALEPSEINDIRDYIPNAKFWNKDKEWYDVLLQLHTKKFYILEIC